MKHPSPLSARHPLSQESVSEAQHLPTCSNTACCPLENIQPSNPFADEPEQCVDPAPNAQDLIFLFDHTFAKSYQTRLVGWGHEPEYLPKCDQFECHRIIFTRDYFASALHEIAHWCIAGEQRRLLSDYGYWYAPDGRSADQQQEFERVEVKPQAIEWLLSMAAGWRFRVSADNLEGEQGASEAFKKAIVNQAQDYCRHGLPKRAQQFADCLSHWNFERRRPLGGGQRRAYQQSRFYTLDYL